MWSMTNQSDRRLPGWVSMTSVDSEISEAAGLRFSPVTTDTDAAMRAAYALGLFQGGRDRQVTLIPETSGKDCLVLSVGPTAENEVLGQGVTIAQAIAAALYWMIREKTDSVGCVEIPVARGASA
ncbi:hypothetical protein KOR42_23630 [Thalassoglobus neptunius]|uniref:Uncharacterized protein n=1 Tax=Thalassoglobus neptunius TaxID=1938619 RepID=A0A5C5X7F2_9PLAN|nr:hypothetical protein [Thalassoglobus neptunius]TWT58976.1 hypothetical protein KOR42_23630 [Thalassoglobus neptunius]